MYSFLMISATCIMFDGKYIFGRHWKKLVYYHEIVENYLNYPVVYINSGPPCGSTFLLHITNQTDWGLFLFISHNKGKVLSQGFRLQFLGTWYTMPLFHVSAIQHLYIEPLKIHLVFAIWVAQLNNIKCGISSNPTCRIYSFSKELNSFRQPDYHRILTLRRNAGNGWHKM